MERRQFLKTLSAGIAAATMPSVLQSKAATSERPNILFVMSDDQSYASTSANGCKYINTPGFDRVASEGVLFKNCFISAPSCCPARGSVLSGQAFYRLKEAAMNHTVWPGGIPLYTDLLEEAGYLVGYTGKGWAPGNYRKSGRRLNPAGKEYNSYTSSPPASGINRKDYARNFGKLVEESLNDNKPFCCWYGAYEPHLTFEEGSGQKLGKDPDNVNVPGFLPDHDIVKNDLLDYAVEVEWFDQHLEQMITTLEEKGILENTIIVVTSDNGMPFPRAKASCYDWGTRMPLAIRWGAKVRANRVVDDFVSSTDFAPTFLEAAGVDIPAEMTGKSLMPVLLSEAAGQVDETRDHAVSGLENHFPGCRVGGTTYPIRTYRTKDYLYIKNYSPERNPVGDLNELVWPKDDPTGGYGDVDGLPTKTLMVEQKDQYPELFDLTFAKRPAEELYDVNADPFNMNNLADDESYADVLKELREKLTAELVATKDPRETGNGDFFDQVAYRYSPYYDPSSVEEQPGAVTDFELKQNYPNPFNATTRITYSLQSSGHVSLKIYDTMGRSVADLVNESKAAGRHHFNFNAEKLSNGTYFYELTVKQQKLVKRMVLAK